MPCMAYAVGQTIEVCLQFDLPPARGLRRVVANFENERGDVVELTDVPAGASQQCTAPYPPPLLRKCNATTIQQRRFPIHAPFAPANHGGTRITQDGMVDDGTGRKTRARAS